jgi:hypothetical protein
MREARPSYLEVTQEAGREFLSRGIQGEIVMLNLLRFRDIADYSATAALRPADPISGADAYRRYMDHTLPLLRAAGGEVAFLGDGGRYLIGPADERWDLVLLVRHRSVQAFMSFATDDAYLEGMGHRLAAISDSRLLPLLAR